ncbi:hypothetical protein FGO68_gene3189 [Halteria grandinella]|uniref:Uncharacterized protein n=1 Tax=Halteria grandinella TaxID=5974 RepID=A0A8J8P2Y4_HALGN|nr:hypothetical protein FGO68_gene3189 [Halteria grandinella]
MLSSDRASLECMVHWNFEFLKNLARHAFAFSSYCVTFYRQFNSVRIVRFQNGFLRTGEGVHSSSLARISYGEKNLLSFLDLRTTFNLIDDFGEFVALILRVQYFDVHFFSFLNIIHLTNSSELSVYPIVQRILFAICLQQALLNLSTLMPSMYRNDFISIFEDAKNHKIHGVPSQ